MPETVPRQAFGFRLQRLEVPAEVVSVFVRAALAGVAAFATSAVFSSVAPEFLGVGLHRHSPALAGLLVFLLFLMSVSGQAFVPRLSNALATGCGLLVVGVALLAASLAADSLAALLASAAVWASARASSSARVSPPSPSARPPSAAERPPRASSSSSTSGCRYR